MNSISIWRALLPLFLFASVQLSAQHTRAIHQSFEIDSIDHLQLDLYGEYEISLWEGNTILTETHVELSDASSNILKHFVKLGRYNIEMKNSPGSAFFTHQDAIRKPIYTKDGQAWEYVRLTIYIPDVFTSTDNRSFRIPEEIEAKAN